MAFLLDLGEGRTLAATNVFGIGRNYADHAREMGHAPSAQPAGPADPVVFLKPATSLVRDGGDVEVPAWAGSVDHEVELAVVIGRGGRDVPRESAMDHVLGYAMFLDMTARDLQAAAKTAGEPWTVAKGLDTFGPIGRVVAKERAPALDDIEIALEVNGTTRQRGRLVDVVHKVPDLVAWLSRRFTLEPGDVIATGTPAGVGPVVPGDRLVATGTGIPTLRVGVLERQG